MTSPNLDDLLQRLIDDNDFRKDFERDRESVLDSFDLADHERDYLTALDSDELASVLEAMVPSGARTIPI